MFWCIWSSEEVSLHSWSLCMSQLSGIWLYVVFIVVVCSESSLFCFRLMQTAWGVGGQSQVVSCHNSCCLTSTLLDGHFLVFEGHISLEDVGGRYREWLRLNLISCLKFLVYLGSFWHSWSGSYVVHSRSLVLSKFNWCRAITKLAYIVHVLASWHEAASHLSHADCDTFTGYNLLPSDQDQWCQWCHQVLILSSLNVQFLGWTSLEAPWCWLRCSVCQISYLPLNKTT
jgi:hypothetical protein